MLTRGYAVSLAGAVLLTGLLSACSQENVGDVDTSSAGVPTGIERFLLFPNPLVQSDGGFETNTTAYADAYYRAVDSTGQRDTLAKWKAVNGFGNGGDEHLVVFRDVRDLGYGRRMTGRRNADGTVAFFVENYSITGVPGGYTSANVEAAAVRDTQWHIGTNSIEWSETPCDPATDPAADCVGTARIAKFYNFSATTGARQLAVDLDGRGLKAMPGPCIACHGGRGDPLTPADVGTSLPRYALVENSFSRKRGDTQARLQGFNVGSFEFSANAGYTRADQESKLKDFNQWVLCTYPGGGVVSGSWGSCTRPAAAANEWQGSAASMVEAWYGGVGMPNAQFSDNYVPAGWSGNVALYNEVVVPYCRTCHNLRGTADQSDIDFDSEAKFQSYADRIKAHVFDRGNMPLAWVVYRDFWQSSAAGSLAAYIDSVLGAGTVTTTSGALREPGRPVADPGPNRMVRTCANATLSAADSLFASSYRWTQMAGPVTATIQNATSRNATFFSNVDGVYTIRLTVSNGISSDSRNLDVTADSSFPDPANIKMAHVIDVLRNNPHGGAQNCTNATCHQAGGNTPIVYTAIDRDGIGSIAATDEDWHRAELRGRANLTEIAASPLLRKPTGNHHSGGNPIDLGAGSAALSSYSTFYHWIANGMPAGGVIANAGSDSSETLVFAGTPPADTVALDASVSVGVTTYSWSIRSFLPTIHPNGSAASITAPTISSAASATATLNAYDIGNYIVRLDANNGSDTDFDERTIVVSETTVSASASPTGTQSLAFSGAPATATLNLASAGTTGNPLTYAWSYASTGLTTGPCGTISNESSATATLTVPVLAIGTSCTFQLSASNLSTIGTTTTPITIAAAAGQNPTASWTAVTTSRCSLTGGTGSTPGASCTWAGSPYNATITLSGSASGVGTLTYQWSVISGASRCAISGTGNTNAETLDVTDDGSCTVRLFVDNGALSSGTTVDKTITVTAGRTFTSVKSVFAASCASAGCHSIGNPPPVVGVNVGSPPSWDDVTDTGSNTLHNRAVARVNLASPASSLLVLNPLGSSASPNINGHTGGTVFSGTSDTDYITFLTWIIGGVPNN